MTLNFFKCSLALVTGASSGIGMALCRLLAKQGIPLVITGRNGDRLDALAAELRILAPVNIVVADLSTPEGLKKIIEGIYEHKPDLLINNAGFGLYGDALSYTTQEQLNIVDVNAGAVLALTLECARILIATKRLGIILNVSSVADFIVMPGLAVYAASKAFVTQLSQSLDFEMRLYGIRVLAACPGVVSTEFRSRAAGVPDATKEPSSMSSEFAAEEIWRQIEKQKRVHAFDLKTRIGCFLARFIPKEWLAPFLAKRIDSYHPKRSLIIPEIGKSIK